MPKSTALANQDDKLLMIREAAQLPEEWSGERVGAAIKLLPKDARRPENAIAFLSMAHAYGLNPFAKEIWGWEDKNGFQTMTSRDGWVKVLRREKDVRDFEFGHVYEGDEFRVVREGTEVDVHHESQPFEGGEIIGAYAIVRFNDDRSPVIQTRKMEDYSNLMGKENWRTSPQEMLLTRVLSFAGRLAVGAPLYTQADFELSEEADVRQVASKAADREAALRDELASLQDGDEEKGGREIEVEDEEEKATTSEPASTSADEAPSPESPSEDGEEELTHFCRTCGEGFTSPQALGGHGRSHDREQTIPKGWRVQKESEGSYDLIDPVGVLHVQGADSWEELVQKAQNIEGQEQQEQDEAEEAPVERVDVAHEASSLLTRGMPEGYGLESVGEGYRAVLLDADGAIEEYLHTAPLSRGEALEVVDDHSGAQGDLLDEPQEPKEELYPDLSKGSLLQRIFEVEKEIEWDGEEALHRYLADELFSELLTEEQEHVNLMDLSRDERALLLSKMEEYES